jgi:hypothetical protein
MSTGQAQRTSRLARPSRRSGKAIKDRVQQGHRGSEALLNLAYELQILRGKPDGKADRVLTAPHLLELLHGIGEPSGPPSRSVMNCCWSRPMAWHRCIDSASALTMVIIQWLVASFRREPMPAFPTQRTREARASKIGSTAVRAESGPEARIVSSPFSAG